MSVLINAVPSQAGGRKRLRDNQSPLVIDQDQDLDLLISGVPSKRATYNCYWDGLECTSSPLTPESGITDMSSPPGAEVHDNAADSPVMRTAAMSSPGPCNVTAGSGIGSIVPLTTQPQQTAKGFMLRILDQPEENYRARYDSEGCRGPMKGRSGGYPTIELLTDLGQKWSGSVKVELVGNDGVPLQSCLLDSGDQRNVNKKLHPSEATNKVSFENLRIRRLKKQDTKSSRSAQNDGHGTKGSNRKTKQDEKIAYLLFTADIKTENNGSVELCVKSEQIYLNANHDPPEIHRIIPSYGTAQGGEQIVIVGTRMHTARVSFFVTTSEGLEQELSTEIDREISHQNALVISTPSLPSRYMMANEWIQARVVVTAGKGDRGGKEPLRSNAHPFIYITQDTCKECYMKKLNNTGIPMHMCSFNHIPSPPSVGMYTSHSSLISQPTMLRQHLVPQQSIYTGAGKTCPSPRQMIISSRPASCASPPTNDFPPVSVAPSDSHLRMLTRPSHSPPPLPSTSQGMLESLFQDPIVTSSPPLSANSTHSLDISATLSPSSVHQVSHLEPSITEVMPFTLSDPSGPVSPEEMSQYLNCSDFPMAPSQEYTPNSTSAFVTDSLHVSRRQQSTNNM